MEDWKSHWKSTQYVDDKLQKIEKLKSHIKSPPKNILDIGCGLAIESEYFQKTSKPQLFSANVYGPIGWRDDVSAIVKCLCSVFLLAA